MILFIEKIEVFKWSSKPLTEGTYPTLWAWAVGLIELSTYRIFHFVYLVQLYWKKITWLYIIRYFCKLNYKKINAVYVLTFSKPCLLTWALVAGETRGRRTGPALREARRLLQNWRELAQEYWAEARRFCELNLVLLLGMVAGVVEWKSSPFFWSTEAFMRLFKYKHILRL